MTFYNENANLAELIDMNSKPIHSLAYKMNMPHSTLADTLSDAYESAKKNGKLIVDGDGIHFETYFANLTLKTNADFTSPYFYYPCYELNPEYQTESSAANESELPDTMDQIYLPYNNSARLNHFVTGNDGNADEELIAKLKKGYLNAKNANAFSPFKDAFTFYPGLSTPQGDPVMVSVKFGNTGWYVNFVGTENSDTPDSISSTLNEFADLGDHYLPEIAASARKEKWFFGTDGEAYGILQNYIAYTFTRLKAEDKICVNDQNGFAAINTGLCSSNYDDVYMCFKRDPDFKDSKWKYAGVCTEKGGSLWKQLVYSFNPLPKAAQYIVSKDDILFDRDKMLFTDTKHIIKERLERIPADFLRPSFSDDPHALILIGKIKDGIDVDESYEELKQIVDEHDEIFNSLSERVEQLVRKTVRMLRWNHRLAIPCYFPKSNSMSMLLPLDFTDCGKAQAALVVQLTEVGNYIGHTLLNMRQAYQDARLISSQESSWLTA